MNRLKATFLAAALIAGCGSDKKAPVITEFGARPGTIAPGGSATLTWQVTNAKSLSIDNGIGSVTGSVAANVQPSADTTYTLSATNEAGTAQASTTVKIDVKSGSQVVGFTVDATAAANAGVSVALTITAVNVRGEAVPSYAGTVHVTSDDSKAVLPADLVFAAADAGRKTASFTAKTAGTVSIIAADAAAARLTGSARIAVAPGAASRLAAAGLPASAAAGDVLSFSLTALDAFGNTALTYAGTVTVTSNDSGAQLPAPYTFSAADHGSHAFAVSLVTAGAHTVSAGDGTLSDGGTVQVTNAAAARIVLSAATSTTAGVAVSVTATVKDRFGNVAKNYAGTVHFTSTDGNGSAQLPADAAFAPADQGQKAFSVTLATAGSQTFTATDTAVSAVTGSASVQVAAAAAAHLTLSGLGGAAIAGDALSLIATATDAFGNLATGYAGTVTVTSDDGAATLPAPHAFTGGDQGLHAFALSLATAGTHTVSIGDGTLNSSANVQIDAAGTSRFDLTGLPGAATAGDGLSTTVTARDRFGNVAVGYRGTAHFDITDIESVAPGDHAFLAGDNGAHAVGVTFVTAGSQSISAHDTGNTAVSGQSAAVSIGPASAAQCQAASVPTNARAGDPLPVRVTVRDGYGNVATQYTGTMTLTSSDTLATLPAPAQYQASDKGARDFSVKLGTLGLQTVTASDGFLFCPVSTSVSAGAAAEFVLAGLASDAVAGTQEGFTLTAKDSYGNLASDYAGTPVLISSDSLASFTDPGGSFVSGVKSFQVAFATVGAQTVTATDGFSANSGPVVVHGLVYTPPAANSKAVQLVAASQSTAALVVLQLVVAAPATGYSVGFNLPADASRAAVTGMSPGNALDPGNSPPAMAAALTSSGPLANTLTSGLSQKAAGSGAVDADASITAGQVLYTVRLKPTSVSSGVIFDGAKAFRAALRDKAGNEMLSQANFAVGRLDLR